MAKFLRSVTDQIIGGGGKTTDIQIVQAVTHFEDEHSKLLKFKREFDKYTQAILTFDNASYRFFDSIRSLTGSTWSQQPILDQSCLDIGRIRGEHLHNLNKQIVSNIDLTLNTFKKMNERIDEQSRIQRDYDRTRKQYQSSIKHDEQTKIDRIQNDLDQLKSALHLVNQELRDDLPKFHLDLQNQYVQLFIELFGIHGKYSKTFHKLCSSFIEKIQGKKSTNSDTTNDNNLKKETQSSSVMSEKKKRHYSPISQLKHTDYKILHQVHVIHDYKAEHEDEIDLIKDEYISVIAFHNSDDNEHDTGWEYGEKSDGTIGLFPVNFAVRLYENEENDRL
jgi:hypothetical protein